VDRSTPWAWLLLAALACGPAQAARPLVTEDAGVLGRGDCEFEGVAARRSLVGPSETTALLQVACGVGLQTQLAGVLGTSRTAGENSLESAATGKTWLRELTDEQAGVAIAYAFAGGQPSGGGWRYGSTTLLGVVTVPLQKELLLHANLGASHSRPDREATAIWAAALELLQVGGSAFDLMAESFGTQRDPAWVSAGVRYTVVPERFTVNASFGVQGGSERAKLATAGFKLNF
jgi:hypothetical protein